MTTIEAGTALDRRGKTITTFVAFDAAAELAKLNRGDTLEVLTDDFDRFATTSPRGATWPDTAWSNRHRLLRVSGS